jgi:hypothetical protein
VAGKTIGQRVDPLKHVAQIIAAGQERFRQTDERIGELVSAIGEFIRRQNAPRP